MRVNGGVARRPRARVAEGDRVEIDLPSPREVATQAQAIALDILYEDADLIVVDKPAGMVVHPAPGSAAGTLVNALLHHCGQTLSGVGGESGLESCTGSTRTRPACWWWPSPTARITAWPRSSPGTASSAPISRWSMAGPDAADPRLRGVRGVSFEPGKVLRIATRLAPPDDRQRQAVMFDGGRHAVTRARVLESFGTPPAPALLDCWLETGRTHQIRVHLAHAGHGLVGDRSMAGGAGPPPAPCRGGAVGAAWPFPARRCMRRFWALCTPSRGRSCASRRRCRRTSPGCWPLCVSDGRARLRETADMPLASAAGRCHAVANDRSQVA